MGVPARLSLAALLAVALTSSSLAPVYADLGWLVRVLGGIVVVVGSGALARAAGLPPLLQPVAMVLGHGAYVLVVFASSTLDYGLLPTTETFRLLDGTLGQGLRDVELLGPPVPSSPGLVLLAVLGTGAIAVTVLICAVILRRVAVAGLPLLLLFAIASAVLPDGLGLLPFVLGAVGWLGLLLAEGSDRASRWGAPLPAATRSAAEAGLGRVSRRIGMAALGVAVVVPAVLPGLDGGWLGSGSGTGQGGGARTTTTYNPITRLAGQLRLPEPQTLLTYRAKDAKYLRLTTLDVFDEASGWSSSELSGDLGEDAVQRGIPTPVGQSAIGTRRVQTEITISDQLGGPWLPVPFPPSDIDIQGPWIWDAEAETAFSTRTQVSEVDEPYVVDATPVEPTPALLRAVSDVPEEIRQTYAQPPAVSDYVRELVARTTAGQSSDYDRVVALQALFRNPANGFRYDDEAATPGINAPDALENFLRGRVGFCEQYSSAMAAMARALGIPARVAVGFVPGRSLGGDRFEVTTDDAHAWPEVWFAGAGWVRFEPTPRDGEVLTPTYSTPAVEPDPAAGPSAAPAPTSSAAPGSPGNTEALDRGEPGSSAVTPGAGSRGDGGLSPAWLVTPALMLLAAAPALLAAGRRRARWRTPGPLTAWSLLQDDAEDVGHRWRPADSPRAATEHLLSSWKLSPATTAALHRLTAAVEQARYARPTGTGPKVGVGSSGVGGGAQALRRDVSRVRAGLLAAAGRRARWRARVLPSSSLRWAALRLGNATTGWLDRGERIRSGLRRRVLRHRPMGAHRAS